MKLLHECKWGIVALMLLTLGACSDGTTLFPDAPQMNQTENSSECVLIAKDFQWEGDASRSSLTVDGEVAKFSWTPGDRVGILPDAGAQVFFEIPQLEEGDEPLTDEERRKATFDGGAWALKATSNYAAYYPFIKDYDLNREKVPVDYTGQKQTGITTVHLGAYDYLGAHIMTTNASGGVNFTFDHVGALVLLRFNVPAAGTALKNVTMSAEGVTFTTKGTYDLTVNGVFTITPASEGGTSPSLNVEVDYTTTADNEEVTVCFMAAPVNLSGKKVNVTVAYGEGADVLSFEADGKDLVAGYGHTLTLSGNDDANSTETAVSVYIPGVITEDSYHAVVWVDGEARFVGSSVDEGFQDAPVYYAPSVLSSFAVNGDDVYVVGWETSVPNTDYYERATIWKNGTIIFQEEQTNSVMNDICVSGSDVYAIGSLNGTGFLWKNGTIVSFPNETNDGKLICPGSIAVSNGDCYMMGSVAYSNFPATYKTFFWKNQEFLDLELDGAGISFAVQGDDIYCLFEKDGNTYLSKNGEITEVGLDVWTEVGGSYRGFFVDGEDVYVVGRQDGIAKIWKNGVVSLLTTEDNKCELNGVYVYNKDVYVVGMEFAYTDDGFQYTVVKLWKNGEESIIDTSSWSHAYPFGVFVAPK